MPVATHFFICAIDQARSHFRRDPVLFSVSNLPDLIASYGCWAIALIVTLESMGVPLPGETMLIAAAIYAAKSGQIHIATLIGSAAAGAILGDNIGYWLGRKFGYPLVVRYGRFVRLSEPRIKLGQYLFMRYGGRIVFLGRFVAAIRTFGALLAGINYMDWNRFLVANAAGGITWAAVYGLGGYLVGDRIHDLLGPLAFGLFAAVLVAMVAIFLFFRSHEKRLQAEAERVLPGPLRHLHGD
jgi:membrane protein DedA with SNARE-associated domain